MVDVMDLLGLDAAPGHDVGPSHAIARRDLAQRGRRRGRGNQALRLESGLGFGRVEDGDDLAVQPFDQIGAACPWARRSRTTCRRRHP